MELFVAIFGVLSLIDVIETYHFPRFGLVEGNKLMARLVSMHGFDALFLVKYVVFVGVLVAAAEKWVPAAALYGVIALQSGIVAWNAYLMWRNR